MQNIVLSNHFLIQCNICSDAADKDIAESHKNNVKTSFILLLH